MSSVPAIPPEPSGIVSPASQILEPLDEVRFAIAQNDWDRLRALSLQPGGFGHQGRKEAWVYLLHAVGSPDAPPAPATKALPSNEHSDDISSLEKSLSETTLLLSGGGRDDETEKPHDDERQVGLDTDRSFVMYPAEGAMQKSIRKTQLHNLIVSILRKRRKLSYFQGYHDVISVLYLTLQDSEQSSGLYPSELLVSCGEKMSLHRLRDSMGPGLDPLVGSLRLLKRIFRAADPDLADLIERTSPLPYFALSNILTLFSHDAPTLDLIQRIFDFLLCRPPIVVIYLAAAVVLSRKAEIQKLEAEGEDGMMHSILSQLPDMVADGDTSSRPSRSRTMDSQSRDTSRSGSQNYNTSIVLRPANEDGRPSVETITSAVPSSGDSRVSSRTAAPSSRDTSASLVTSIDSLRSTSSTPSLSIEDSILHDETSKVAPEPEKNVDHEALVVTSGERNIPPPPSGVPVSSLLQQADYLYARYPPSSRAISPGDIMGPNSVIFTWSQNDFAARVVDLESPSSPEKNTTSYPPTQNLPADDDAEDMVEDKSMVVLPYDPMEDMPHDEDEDSLPVRRPVRRPRVVWDLSKVDKKVVLTGVVLLIGVGVAIYTSSGGAGRRRAGMEWAKWGKWLGGVVIGLGTFDDMGSIDDEL